VSKEQRAEGMEQRAESMEHGAWSNGRKVEGLEGGRVGNYILKWI